MVLGFKEQFVDKIKCKIKIHTIREDKSNRWKTGNKINFATGVRTKNYRQFAEGVCSSIFPFEIKYTHKENYTKAELFINSNLTGDAVWINDELVAVCPIVKLISRNDGFDSVNQFFEWFDKDFKGKLILWDLTKLN